MTAGYETFSGISSDGGLYIWGSDLVDDSIPITEPKLLDEGPWLQVGVGLRFMCALKETDRNIYCLGEGNSGQLGDGGQIGQDSAVNKLTPIVGGRTFDSLCVGTYHACAITDTGKAFCWGDNSAGQLGSGDNVSSSTPIPVFSDVDMENWREISCGSQHTCATKSNDEGWCWGLNNYKQVSGQGEEVTRIPSQIEGRWQTISAGDEFTLGIDSLGSGFGWGLSERVDLDFAIGGQLGDNSTLCYNLETGGFCAGNSDDFGSYDYEYSESFESFEDNPVPIAGNKVWQSISAGRIPCAVEAETFALYCWGYTTGEALVDGSPQSNFPVLVDDSTEWVSVSSGPSGARCGIQTDGSGWCWGRNTFNCEGECPLGDGTLKNSAVPVQVVKIKDWINRNATPPESMPPTPQGSITNIPPPGEAPLAPAPVPSSGSSLGAYAAITYIYSCMLAARFL